jgi:hypothetical protein
VGYPKKTLSAETAARVIVNGFGKRSRRICVPEYLPIIHALRPLLTTRLLERELLALAPDMEAAFLQAQADRGTEA